MKNASKDVLSAFKNGKVIPLFSHGDEDVSCKVLEACHRGGMNVFEYTNRQKNSYEIFRKLVEYKTKLPGFLLGIGTVMDAETAQRFIDAGADFIISPIMKPEMASVCVKNDIPWMPGCHTVTEIVEAFDHGATLVKVFPGSVLGPKFISAIRPVIPDAPLMVTGGVEPTEESFRSWFSAGATCVGLGSNLFSKDILETKDYSRLETRVRETLRLVSDF